MNPIKIEDLFDPNIAKDINKIVKSLETGMGVVTNALEKVRGEATKLASTPLPTGQTEETKKMATAAKALSDEYKALLQEYGIYKETLAQVTQVERDQNAILKLQAQYADAADGSYNKLSAEYRLLKVAMNAMGTAEEGEIKRLEIMKRRAAELYEQMNEYQKATGKYTLQVGDYSKALNGLQLSTQQIVREMPTLANSLSQFFMAISNNVPIFVDNFKRARQELGSFQAALKGTLSALFSWQTVLIIILTVLPKIAKAIHDKKKAQQEANKETKEAFEREKELLSLEEKIAQAEQKSVSQLKTLYAITQDVSRSEKERAEAASTLQQLYPETLKNYSQEAILAGDAKTAVDELTHSLVLQAQARGYLNEIEDLSQQRAKKNIELLRLRRQETQQQTKVEKARIAAEEQGYLTAATPGGFRAETPAARELRKAQEEFDATAASINNVDSELQDLENTIDDIIKMIPTEGLAGLITSGSGKGKGAKEQKIGDIPDYILEYYDAIIAGMEDGLEKQKMQLDREEIALAMWREKEWDKLQKQETIARQNNDQAALAQIEQSAERLELVYKQKFDNIIEERLKLQHKLTEIEEEETADPLAKVRRAYVEALNAMRQYSDTIQQGLDEGRKIGQDELKDWQEVIKKKLEAEAEYQKAKKQLELQGRLDAKQISEAEYNDLLQIEYAKIDSITTKAIDKLGKQKGKKWNLWVALFGKDIKDEATGTISRVLGEDVKFALDQTMNGYKMAAQYVNEYIDSLAKLAERAIKTANTEVDMAKMVYEKELEAKANGYANSVDLARQEYEEKLALQKKAQQEAAKIQKLQQDIETATQAANLLTATTSIIASYASLPGVGQALAAASIAAMWVTFLAAKAKASQVTKYGEGMSEYLDYGGSHASGNDIDFGMDRSGRRRRVERGEVIGVINRRNVAKYGVSNVRGIIDSLNKGNFEYKYGNAFGSAWLTADSGPADLSKLEGGVNTLVKQGQYRETYVNGQRIIQYKNLRRVVR